MSAKVPRSALDATRFTSTTPYATSKPFPSPSVKPKTRIPNATSKAPDPKRETPQEKVKRLRAALDKSRAAKETTLDRVIFRGRAWADRAHRYTATALMGFTVLACGVTVYALVDMAIHNRRKKHEYLMDKKAAYAAGLMVSRKAIEEGTANQAQIDLVEYDDAETVRQEMLHTDKEAKKGRWWRDTKDMLFGGLRKEEDNDALARLVGAQDRAGNFRHGGGESQDSDDRGHNVEDQARQESVGEKEKQTGEAQRPVRSQLGSSEAKSKDELTAKTSWSSYLLRR